MKFSPSARKVMAADRRAYRAAQREQGLTEVRVWVPIGQEERIRQTAAEMRSAPVKGRKT